VGSRRAVEGAVDQLEKCCISGNSAKADGGGVYAQDDNPFSSPGVLTFNNATLTNNTADSDINSLGDGGGIRATSGTIAFYNSIIAGNFDTPNNSGPGTKHPDCSGIFASPRFTLVGRNDGCAGFVNGSNGNLVGSSGSPIDALLAPLANNGGPLAGAPSLAQRGLKRPLGQHCDMGAFEAGGFVWLPVVVR
jgi:predicted outer membrane repeat protein